MLIFHKVTLCYISTDCNVYTCQEFVPINADSSSKEYNMSVEQGYLLSPRMYPHNLKLRAAREATATGSCAPLDDVKDILITTYFI